MNRQMFLHIKSNSCVFNSTEKIHAKTPSQVTLRKMATNGKLMTTRVDNPRSVLWLEEGSDCVIQALPQKCPILALVINTKRLNPILPLSHLIFTVPTERG